MNLTCCVLLIDYSHLGLLFGNLSSLLIKIGGKKYSKREAGLKNEVEKIIIHEQSD